MVPTRVHPACLIPTVLLLSGPAWCEDAISSFDDDWAVSPFVNYNMGSFSGFDSREYRTDKPFDVGVGLRYKWLSAAGSVSTSFSEPFDLWSFDIDAASYFDSMYVRAYFKRYRNMAVVEDAVDSSLDIHSSGIMAMFVHNSENHSLGSVVKLEKRQNVSSGSLLYGFGVFHSSLYSAAGTIERYKDRLHLLYFGPCVGYSHTWVFRNRVFLNVALVHVASPGVDLSTKRWLYIPQAEPQVVVGHHHDSWSMNFRVMNLSKFLIWNKSDVDNLTLISWTWMFSQRF